MADRYKILSEKDYTNYIFENYPVRIETIRILADNKTKKNLVQFKLSNISDEVIDNITLKTVGYDLTDTPLITVDDFMLGALEIKPKEAFGGQNPIELDDPRVSYAKLFIKRVVFKNGEEWSGEEETTGVEADTEEKEIVFQEKLRKELNKCADNYGFQTKCMFGKYDRYWRCSCGHINNLTSKSCYFCGAQIDVLGKVFSEEYLQKLADETEVSQKDNIYNMAKQAECEETENKLQEAINYYKQIKGWKDSEEHINICMQKLIDTKEKIEKEQKENQKKKRRKALIIGGIAIIAVGIVVGIKAYQTITYNKQIEEVASNLVVKNDKIKMNKESMVLNTNTLFETKNGATYSVRNISDLKYDKVGEYTLKVDITKGDLTVEKDVKIQVYDDEAPKLSVSNVFLTQGQNFDENSEVQCSDNSEEKIQPKVIENNVDTSKPGTYKVVYEAKDSSGNTATAERKVVVHKEYNYKELKKNVKKLMKKSTYKNLKLTCDDKVETLRIQGKKSFTEKGPSNKWIWNTTPYVCINKNSDENTFRETIIVISIYAEEYRGLIIKSFSMSGDEDGLELEPVGTADYSNNGTIVNSVAQYYIPQESMELYDKIVTGNGEIALSVEDREQSLIGYLCSSKDKKILKELDKFYKEIEEYL